MRNNINFAMNSLWQRTMKKALKTESKQRKNLRRFLYDVLFPSDTDIKSGDDRAAGGRNNVEVLREAR